jgi:pteridine reductase
MVIIKRSYVARCNIANSMPEYKPETAEKSELSGKTALITGGARRIGACISQTLHAAGMNVVIHYRSSATSARALQKELNARRKDSCILIQCDLSEHNKLKPLIDQSVQQLGRLDVLINNASAFFPTDDNTHASDWDKLLDTNLKAPFFLMQAAAPHLKKQRGCIINLIDIYAQRPLEDHAVYCASKAGLASLTRSFAQSLAPDVRVNGVSPGAILWPENQHDEIAQKRQLSRTPLKRLGQPQDIADATLFLIQDAAYMTGQILSIDGGRSTMP